MSATRILIGNNGPLRKNTSPYQIAQEKGWIQEENTDLIEKYILEIMTQYPDKVKAYQNGNTNLLGLFMGEIMKKTQGKFNPKTINTLLQLKLQK